MKIHVMVKRPGQPPRSVWIEDSLKNLQRNVGGYIEAVPLGRKIALLCDEEGLMKDSKFNVKVRRWYDDGTERGALCDMPDQIFGDIVVCGVSTNLDGEEYFDSLPCEWAVLKQAFPELWGRER